MLNLNHDMIASPNFVRFVYDGDGSDTPTAGPPGSAQIEQVFLDWFDSQGLATEPTAFDGRSDYGPFIARGAPAGGLFTGAEVHQDGRAGGGLRRRRRCRVRPLLPPGVRRHHQPQHDGVRPDGRRRGDGAGDVRVHEEGRDRDDASAAAVSRRRPRGGWPARRTAGPGPSARRPTFGGAVRGAPRASRRPPGARCERRGGEHPRCGASPREACSYANSST